MIASHREEGGRLVHVVRVRYVRSTQASPKPPHVVPWLYLPEWDKEGDRVVWEKITDPYRQRIAQMEEAHAQQLREIQDLRIKLSLEKPPEPVPVSEEENEDIDLAQADHDLGMVIVEQEGKFLDLYQFMRAVEARIDYDRFDFEDGESHLVKAFIRIYNGFTIAGGKIKEFHKL